MKKLQIKMHKDEGDIEVLRKQFVQLFTNCTDDSILKPSFKQKKQLIDKMVKFAIKRTELVTDY